MERKRKVIPCRWTEDKKGAGTSSGESGARNLEALRVSAAEVTAQLIILCTLISLFLMNEAYSLYCQHEEYQQQ